MSTEASGPGDDGQVQPLEGLRVIELGDYLSPGFATSLLGDFGAEVIKIDLPGHVDNSRMIGGRDEADPQRSPHFASMARNKRSVTLDVRGPGGREVFLQLIAKSDVLVENFRPGTLERWGLGFDELKARNPDIIVLRISAFGQTGPLREAPGVDGIGQAFGGLVALTGYPDGPPVRAGVVLADYVTGLFGAFGVVLALQARRPGVVGETAQVVDAALYESFLPMLGAHAVRYQRYGNVEERRGNQVPGVTPGNLYRARDGWVMMSATGDALFARLAVVLDRQDWLDDPRFVSRDSRFQNREEIEDECASWIAARAATEAVTEFLAQSIPASKANTIEDLLEDPQVAARNAFLHLDDPVYGDVVTPAPTPRLSRTPGGIRSPAPRPGEHNEQVFGELLGLDAAALDQLRADGTI